MELEDSPKPEVQALLDDGALHDGLECGREGGVGPTRVWYLLGAGAGAAAPGGWNVGAAKEEPTGGLS